MIDPNTGNYVPTTQEVITAPAPPTAETVYSADNITQAVTSPVKPVDLSDPTGIYDYYLKGENVLSSQAKYQADQTALAKAKATASARQTAIEQNPLESMQYIVGAQSRAGQLDAQQLAALSDAASISQSAYLAAQSEAREKAQLALDQRNQLTSLIIQNPGAKITYNDTVEAAAKKIEKYNKEQAKEAEKKEKDEYKKKLKSAAIQLGISLKTDKGGTRNTSQLEKEIAKYYKEQGLAKSTSNALDLALKRKQLTGGNDLSDTEIKTKNENSIFSAISSLPRGNDNFTNPNDWKPLLDSWINADMSATEFFNKFGQYINPRDI